MFSVLLLGPPQVTLGGHPIKIPRRKSRALLYYLAAHPAPVTREQILNLFWPDDDRATAQQVLRTMLYGLRKELGSALISAEDTLALAADVDVDVRRLEALLLAPGAAPDELAAALERYRGDFLDGFRLPDTPPFDDWIVAQRERYQQLVVRGLTMVAESYEERHNFPAALDAIQRAIALDPLQEDVQRTCMRLLYLAGDRAGAIRRYEQLRRLLDEELGVPPMAETRALYDAIIRDELPANERPASSTLHLRTAPARLASPSEPLPFIGRAVELEQLFELVKSRQLALIEGEPGIGKTRLAEELIRATGALALTGAARELERSLPYQPVIEALRGLLASPEWPALRRTLELPDLWLLEVARLLPELAPASPIPAPPTRAADESRLWEAINQFLQALARQRQVLLFLDDLHWADASTLAMLGYLVRQAAAAPILFVAATRPVAPRSALADLLQTLIREGRLGRLPIGCLSLEDTTALARRLSPAYAEPLADWLARNAEGNPYILAELVRYARERSILLPNGTVNLTALSASPVVPPTVYSLIQSRLARLSESARRMLDTAVAAGREFEFEVVTRAAALSEAAALDALDELRAAGLIRSVDDGRYTFDHTLTMEVAYREVSGPRHRLLHRRIAEALESLYRKRLDSIAGLLAAHFAEGNAPERAAHYAFRAGRYAAGLAAWKEAIAFYEQALISSGDGQRVEVLMALAEAHLQSGEAAQASEAYQSALGLVLAQGTPGGIDPDQIRLALGHSLLIQARYSEAIALARKVLAGGRPEYAVKAEWLWGAALSVEGADLAGAAEHLQTAASLCAAQADPATFAQITFELGSLAAQQGDLQQAVARYRRALEAAQQGPAETTIDWVILAHNNLAYHLHLLGDAGAIEHAQAGLRLAEEKGMVALQPYLLSTLGEIALARDDLAAAEEYFARGLRLAEQLSIPERIAGLTANLGLLDLRRGQPALALHRLSTALAQADALGVHHLAAQIRVWLAPLLPPSEARARLAEARATAERGGRRRLLDEIERLETTLAPV